MREFGGSRLRFVFDCLSFISSPQTTSQTQSTRLLYAGVTDRTEQERVQKQCRIKKWSSPAAAAKSESCRELLKRLWGWKGEPPRWSLDSLRFLPLPILSPSSFAHYIFLPAVCWLLLLRLSSGAACSEAKDFPSFFCRVWIYIFLLFLFAYCPSNVHLVFLVLPLSCF